jgi:mRNA interferase MazF
VWWADLPEPFGSEPRFRRPVVIVQADPFNRSRISTVVVAALTSNLRLRNFPGNVYLSPRDSGLNRPSVVNASQLATLDRGRLLQHVGHLEGTTMRQIDQGLRLVLAL